MEALLNMKQPMLSQILLLAFLFQSAVASSVTNFEDEHSDNPVSFPASSSLSQERGSLHRNRTTSSIIEASRSRQRQPSRCGTRSFVLAISHPNCTSRRVSVQGCIGHCTSSAVPVFARRSPTTLVSTCRCCRPVAERTGYVLLQCRLHSRSTVRRVNIRAATVCNCRPCTSDV